MWLAPIALGDAEPVAPGLPRRAVHRDPGRVARARRSCSTSARGSGTGSRWQPVRALDAVGGAALSAVAVLVVAWALGVAIAGSGIGGVTADGAQLRGAGQGQRPDAGAPTACSTPSTTWSARRFFPRYLEPFSPERIVEVGPGAERLLSDPDVEARRRQRAQDPRHQRLRPRRRGHRLRLLRRPADDQRPRRRRRGRPGGRDRRRHGRGGGRLLQLRARHRGPGVRHRRRSRRSRSTARPSRATGSRSWATRRTARTTCSPAGSAPSSGCAPRTSTARAPSSARCSRCAGWCGPGNSGGPIVSLRGRRRRRGVRGVGDRRGHRLRDHGRPGRAGVPRSGLAGDEPVVTGDCAG